LKGVQIDHSINDLQEGHEYIMTFKDTHVIIQDNEEEDNVLENIELQSSFKQKMLQRRKAESAGITMDQDRRVLPQYDEDEEE
jgi:predicted P-loop ATPase